jgi:hypothetical protein
MEDIAFFLDRINATLIVFTACAAAAGIATAKPWVRSAFGLAGIAVAACIPISERSLFDWLVSAVERPSAPGIFLLIVFAIAATTGRVFRTDAEYRFGTAAFVLAGIVLYPAAAGFLDYDTYVLGYSGYLLPLLLAGLLGYALYRRYFFVALALNIAILGFLFGAGRSLNLWDYVIDPIAWLFAIGAWLEIVIIWLIQKFVHKPAPVPSPAA